MSYDNCMFMYAPMLLQTNMEEKMLHEAKKAICDTHQRFVEAEMKEDRHTRELFEKLLETMEKDSWKHWDLNRPN